MSAAHMRTVTGRVQPNTQLENLQQQFLDIKHQLSPEPPTGRACDITYAKFFTRFDKVAGMTGTAVDISGILWDIYNLSVRPCVPVLCASAGRRIVCSVADALWIPAQIVRNIGLVNHHA